MKEKQAKILIGALLHDVGRLVCGTEETDPVKGGEAFLRDKARIKDEELLDCVRIQGTEALRQSGIAADSFAWLVCLADEIAAGADSGEDPETKRGFDRAIPLDSIFNILNGNSGHAHYRQPVPGKEGEINYPSEEPFEYQEAYGQMIREHMKAVLKNLQYNADQIQAILDVLEEHAGTMPSSASADGMRDISLFDHMKLTAALAVCMEQYNALNGITDYREQITEHLADIFESRMFFLYALDISGVQSFIYTISSEGALRGLRARSFYLEILMEQIVDELLARLDLARTNLIYCGGGHGYLLLPGTDQTLQEIKSFERETNQWFLDQFGTALYIAGSGALCSANDLMNRPVGSYAVLHRKISEGISAKKVHRYSWDMIQKLNSRRSQGERECRICRRADRLDEKDRCRICAALERFSGDVLYKDYFIVSRSEPDDASDGLPLPGGCQLTAATDPDACREAMRRPEYVRCYKKNCSDTDPVRGIHIHAGDYTSGGTFEDYAQEAKKAGAIARIGILRADVDNLGTAFAEGFQEKEKGRYATLSRTAALSRQLTLFFKQDINQILAEKHRHAAIVYSGGDDLFIVGAWNEMPGIFEDLRTAFCRFTQGTLTLSGGIGMYVPGYPIHLMAEETMRLEEAAKAMDGKDAITLFEPGMTFSWDCYIHKVMGEKYRVISTFFEGTPDYGKAFLYHLIELLRGAPEKVNFVRLIYLLSRMEPGPEADAQLRETYQEFSKSMHHWVQTADDRLEAEAAICLYIYLTRERNSEEEAYGWL